MKADRAEEPVGNWSPRWLGYSRYDAVVLMEADLEGLERGPADSQAVRTALWQYVEAGGTLLVLGDGKDGAEGPQPRPLALPANWKSLPEPRNGVRVCHGGFGLCLHVPNRDTGKWNPDTWREVTAGWSRTAGPSRSLPSVQDANQDLPIIDDLGLPVRGLFVLLLLFTVAIGPCNLWLLARWKRRIWLLWTVPALSLFTCAVVFGYMIVAEGWQGRTRVLAFTLLDESSQRAVTLGRSASYSPLTPGDGLHFSQDTEVTTLGMEGSGGSVALCEIDWTRDQHLRRGWMSARVPAHFQLRRSEVKRLERLPVTREADGSPKEVTNQLGASIRKLYLADDKGRIFTAEAIGVGERAALNTTRMSVAGKNPLESRRQLYASNEWASLGRPAGHPLKCLGPRTYLAVLESSPFLEPGLAGAVVRPTDSYVLGLLAEE